MGPADSTPVATLSGTVAPDPVAASSGGVVTFLNALGCNQSICIQLIGSGLTLSQWNSQATLPASMCSYAVYWARGSVWKTSNTVCGTIGSVAWSYYGSTTWPNKTQLCNTWGNIAGKPCETVHS
jgi:hypothetical protein